MEIAAVPLSGIQQVHFPNSRLKFPLIEFTDERLRLFGQIVVTADLTGQMAERTYLEKLLFLYLKSIEKNIAYLSKVIEYDEEYLSMLKRGGIAEKSQTLAARH